MNKFQSLYHQLHLKRLYKRLDKLNVFRKPTDFESSQNIGLLYDASDPVLLKSIKDYVGQLRDQGKKVTVLGFFNDKKEHGDFPFQSFNQKDLDWLSCPRSNHLQVFMDEPFDILITYLTEHSLPLEFISACSQAHMRIGPYIPNTDCFDLMIDTNTDEFSQFISTVEHYLEKLKSTRYEQAST